jgi:hypothetical protein
MLLSIPNGDLTGLRSFMQKVHLTRSPQKETTLRSAGQSSYDDLECGDWDYHTHLRKDNPTEFATQRSKIDQRAKS